MFFKFLKKTSSLLIMISLGTSPGYSNDSLHVAKLSLPSSLFRDSNSHLDLTQEKNIWTRVQKRFAISYKESEPRIQQQIQKVIKNHSFKEEIRIKAAPYFHIVVEEVEKRGLPSELALIPFVESSYNPSAVQPKTGAAGLWQIMSETGKWFGLQKEVGYDGRHDIHDSTRAALSHLSYLYKKFGHDWLLAIAAYNCGEGTVLKAIKKNKKMGHKTDFWSLSLPQETKLYVPKILALCAIVKHPDKYKYALPLLPNEAYLVKMTVSPGLDLHQLAQLAGLSPSDFAKYNAGYKKQIIPQQGPYHVLVPISRAKHVKQTLAKIKPSKPSRTYLVQSGDSLSKIASLYHIPIRALIDANQLGSTSVIRPGQSLKIPINSTLTAQLATSTPITHIVKKGDSLWQISQDYDISIGNIQKLNNLKSAALHPGQKLIIKT